MNHILSFIKHTIAVVINSVPTTCTSCSSAIPCLVVVDPIEQHFREAKLQRRHEWIENSSVKPVQPVKSEHGMMDIAKGAERADLEQFCRELLVQEGCDMDNKQITEEAFSMTTDITYSMHKDEHNIPYFTVNWGIQDGVYYTLDDIVADFKKRIETRMTTCDDATKLEVGLVFEEDKSMQVSKVTENIPAFSDGMTVYYVTQEGEHTDVSRVATIYETVDKAKGIVNLMVIPRAGDFKPDELFFRKEGIRYSKAKTYATWHLIGEVVEAASSDAR